MFQSISWQQYFTCIIIATLLYYLFVWVVYFKAKLPAFSAIGNFRESSLHCEDGPDELISTAQHVMDELRPVFTGTITKNELLFALQAKLQQYNEWEEPAFRDTINEFIIRESQSKCSIRLGEEDQRALWLQA